MTVRLRSVPFLLLALVGLVAGLACSQGGSGTSAPVATDSAGSGASGEVLAEINGEPITEADLNAWIKEDLLRRELGSKQGAELFEFRRGALDQMLLERAIRDEAAKRGLDPGTLLAQEVSELGPVTDADVQAFYDEHKSRFRGATLEQMEPRIRAFLEHEKQQQARESVRERADVVVHLEPPRVRVAANGPSLGPADAPVTIVEFTDYQCPFCRRAEPTIKEIVERYPDDVRLVVRNLPLDSIHPMARGAAYAAVCAEKQGRFWDFHDMLFAHQDELSPEDLVAHAKELGLDTDAFQACVADTATRDRVDDDVEAARDVGVSGTPAFFVNGILLTGAKPVDEFVRLIESELASKKGSKSS